MALLLRSSCRPSAALTPRCSTSAFPPAKRRKHSSDATPNASSSANHDEIAHFTRLADHWWDEEGEFKVLHRMNRVRAQFLRQRVAFAGDADPRLADEVQFLKGLRVLDVGCGGGLFTEVLARLGATTIGLDAAVANIAVAEVHALETGLASTTDIAYRHATAEQLVAEGEQYDIVCSMEVVEHVEDPRGFLQSLASLTRPGGHLIMSTINRNFLARFVTITVAEHPLLGFVTPGTHSYRKFIKPHEIETFFADELRWRRPASARRFDADNTSEALTDHLKQRYTVSPDEQVETRGVIYSPWSGQWSLQPRYGGPASKLINYFVGARRPWEDGV